MTKDELVDQIVDLLCCVDNFYFDISHTCHERTSRHMSSQSFVELRIDEVNEVTRCKSRFAYYKTRLDESSFVVSHHLVFLVLHCYFLIN